MQALKRKRTQLRREFTLAADNFDSADERDVEDSFTLLSDIADQLMSVEMDYRNLWCESEIFNEAEFEVDQNKAMEYKTTWTKIRNKYTRTIQASRGSSPEGSLSGRSTVRSLENRKYLKMPKLELTKFDGDVKKWLMFWGQFKKIDQDPELDDADKFQYLLQAMTENTCARTLVESYPPSGKNYKKALDALKARFARDDILIETYVRGLLNLVLKQQRGQITSLPQLYDSLQTHLQALESLGVTKDKYASILFPMMESALPEDRLRTWNRVRTQIKDSTDSDLNKLMQFLKEEVESEERILLAKQGFDEMKYDTTKTPTACFVSEPKTSTNVSRTTCLWCDRDTHVSSECNKAMKMSLKERLEVVSKKKACQICLKTNHFTKKCRSFPKCLYCKRRHIMLLCPDLDNHAGDKEVSKKEEKSENLFCQGKTTTLLQTIAVKVKNNEKELCVRALFDSGSQRSYVKKELIKTLDLKPKHEVEITQCLFGGIETKKETCGVYNLSLKSTVDDNVFSISAIEQNKLCSALPKVRSDAITKQLFQNGITLADNMNTPDEISILIGADFCGQLLTGDVFQLDNLTAVRTKLGWTIQGVATGVYSNVVSSLTTLHCLTKVDLSDLWSLESLGIHDPSERVSKIEREKEVIDYFNETTTINSEGRYEVCLPWNDNFCRPKPNYQLAKNRLMSTTTRLLKLGKMCDYDKVFKEWLDLEIIEEAPMPDPQVGVYLPHHPVIRESSQTTKIRPVFDASAKDGQGVSLNGCLEKGKNLIELIPGLVLNFRKEAYGVTADIAKAFLQISLSPEDRDNLKFLWWSDVNDDAGKSIITYRHKRVVFGVTSSPFQLAATILYHLDRCPTHLQGTASILKKSYYVDNCVTSVATAELMHKFIAEAKEIMNLGKFDLRCWVSAPERVDEKTEEISVLGIVWNTMNDDLCCNVSSITGVGEKVTKRSLLSITQKIFDPMGVCCATTIVPKMILQRAWLLKLSWDDELPTELSKEFEAWVSHIHLISNIKLPRRMSRFNVNESQNSIHVFCDASQHAYSACIFLRSEQNSEVHVSLLMAKSRVTPLKDITIPRLELIAATLATRLCRTVVESLNLPNCSIYYWTDSSVVLSWIQNEGQWSVFVTNRVREIRAFSSIKSWRHVPGHMNPADLPSRGTTAKSLLQSRWWMGPEWLCWESSRWPTLELPTDMKEVDKERKTSVNLIESKGNKFLESLAYFSSYTKIVRMLSWMLRFKKRFSVYYAELSYEEIEYAERILIRVIQSEYSQKIDKMVTFKDDKGISRLNTKLNYSDESFNFKFPIILPACEIIIQRLVEERHSKMQHAGAATLLAHLRETYWIIGVRRLVKNVVRNCMICKRYKAKHCETPISSLPVGRIGAQHAFEVTGVDLAGPLILRSGSKCWIVLFTCATYRAVHLEVVETLSTHDFTQALRRFIARRGRIKVIYSDNATNFTGLKNSLSALDWTEIMKFSSVKKITWKNIPPGSPWWGGFYERLIGVMKEMLRRVLGRASVTLTELQTILCDCERTINERPLTYVDNSIDGLKPLTPAMFIQPTINGQVNDLDTIDGKSINIRARYCQNVMKNLRERFRNEYVGHLIHKTKQKQLRGLQPGDVVLLESEGKRIDWPLGVVEEVFPSADGAERVARVRTATGYRVRAFQRIYPLELGLHDTRTNVDPDISKDTSMTKADTDDDGGTTRYVTRSGRTSKIPERLVPDFSFENSR